MGDIADRRPPTFVPGKAGIFEGGDDVALLVSGTLMNEAREAAALLKEQGIGVTVADFMTVKPLDTEAVKALYAKTKMLVSVERALRLRRPWHRSGGNHLLHSFGQTRFTVWGFRKDPRGWPYDGCWFLRLSAKKIAAEVAELYKLCKKGWAHEQNLHRRIFRRLPPVSATTARDLDALRKTVQSMPLPRFTATWRWAPTARTRR